MPKIVCSECQVEFRPTTNGVKVIEYASFGPYKIWEADEWECPKCLALVVTGFAQEPRAEHFEDGFDDLLSRFKKSCPNLIRHDFEHWA